MTPSYHLIQSFVGRKSVGKWLVHHCGAFVWCITQNAIFVRVYVGTSVVSVAESLAVRRRSSKLTTILCVL